MPPIRISISLLLIFLFCFAPVSVFAKAGPLVEPLRITAHTGENYAPAVSPDGTRLAFVSNRNGNPDIYIKPLGKAGAGAVQVTVYMGVDNSPAWSPDGKRIAFVSHREDPDGDIYILDLSLPEPDASPRRLTGLETADSAPAWSHDGEALFFATRDKLRDVENIRRLDLKTGESRQVTKDGGSMPAVSPNGEYLAFVSVSRDPGGDIAVMRLSDGRTLPWAAGPEPEGFPAWDVTGKILYFTRAADDTNLDGAVDVQDNPSIWSVAFSNALFGDNNAKILQKKQWVEQYNLMLDDNSVRLNFRQLTDGSAMDIFPVSSSRGIFYSSSGTSNGRSRNPVIHIYKIPRGGIFPLYQDATHAISEIEKISDDSPYKTIMALRDVLSDFPPFKDPSIPASILYRLGKEFKGINNPKQAIEHFKLTASSFSGTEPYAGLSKIETLVIGTGIRSVAEPSKKKKIIVDGIHALKELATEYKGITPLVSGTATLRAGDLYLAVKEHVQAMNLFDSVASEYKDTPALAAEALFLKSRVYLDLGDRDRLVEAFLNVIRKFPEVTVWSARATEEIITLNTSTGPLKKRIERLYRLSDEYSDLPMLPAAALNRAGDLYYQDNEALKAKQAYYRVLERFPGEKEERRKARFALAKIFFEEEEFEKSFAIYKELEVDPASAFQSRKEFLSRLITKGERELKSGEARLAVKSFKVTIGYDYQAIEAHRGLVRSYAALNLTDKAVRFYRRELERLNKESPPSAPSLASAHYALGLALTYYDPPRLEESLRHIEKAVNLNGGVSYFFLTLGWLNEQKFQDKEDNNYLEKAADAFQTAISLSRDQARYKELPDLWLNLGNVQYKLQNYSAAYIQYKKRLKALRSVARGKVLKEREAIYFERFGEVAFKMGKPEEAVDYFSRGISLIEGGRGQERRIADLNARIGLVHQDSADFERAVESFSAALDLYHRAGDLKNVAVTLRNIANNLYFSTEREGDKGGRIRSKKLKQALNRYFETIAMMEKGEYKPAVKQKKKRGALIQIEMEQGLDDDMSLNARGFSRRGEEKLIFNYIGKIYGDLKEFPKAIKYLKKKLSLTPAPTDLTKEGAVPVLLERAIIENQLGLYLYMDNNPTEALSWFTKSFERSVLLDNKFGIAVNALNMGRLSVEAILTGEGIKGESLTELMDRLTRADTLLQGEADYIYDGTVVNLKNLLGLLSFSISRGWGMPPESPNKERDQVRAVSASLAEIDKEFSLIRSSQAYFSDALEILDKLPTGAATFSTASARAVLENNLALAGGRAEPLNSALLPPDLHWQASLLSAAKSGSDSEETTILVKAAKELEAIPYGLRLFNKMEMEMGRELFKRLAWLLMKSGKVEEALITAEEGREWELRAWRATETFSFEDPEKEGAYMGLIKLVGEIRDLYSGQDQDDMEQKSAQAKARYLKLISKIAKEFPDIAPIFIPQPAGESIKEARAVLGKDEAVLRAFKYRGSALEWVIKKEGVKGWLRPLPSPGAKFKFTLGPDKLKRLYLIPDRLTAQTDLPSVEVSWVASIGHLKRSYNRRNLNSSNLLLAGRAPPPGRFGNDYRNVSVLERSGLTKDALLAGSRQNGVVALSTELELLPNPMQSRFYFEEGGSMANRLEFHELYGMANRDFLIALSIVKVHGKESNGPLPLFHLMALADALTYAGFPHAVINIGPFNKKLDEAVISRFLPLLRSQPPSKALLMAKGESGMKGISPNSGPEYRLFGYGGMYKEERSAFAKKHLRRSITQGRSAKKKKEWAKALFKFENALSLLDALNTEKYRLSLYKELVAVSQGLNDYPKAINYQRLLLEETRNLKKPAKTAKALFFLGYLYYKGEDFPSAVERFQTAIRIFKENRLTRELARAYERLGMAQAKAADYKQALESHEASMEISAEAGRSLAEAKQLNWLGEIHLTRLNEYETAASYFRNALKIYEANKKWKGALASLLGLGRSYQTQSRFDDALEVFQRALDLAIREKLDKKVPECRLEFANTWWYQGQYQKAFNALASALQEAVKMDDKRRQLLIYNTLGLVYWTLNDHERALSNLEQSLDLARFVNSDLDMASAFNNMGLIHRDAERYKEALAYFNKALKIDTRLKSRWGMAYSLRNIGMTYIKMGDLAKAGENIEQAYRMSKEINDRTNLVKSMLERGNIAYMEGRLDDALARYQETNALTRKIGVREVEWRALRGQARVFAKMGRRADAVRNYKEGVLVVEEMRAGIKVEELRNGFAEDKNSLYEELIIQLLEEQKVTEAFNFSERARARSFIDLLGNQKLTLKNSVDQKEYEDLVAVKEGVYDTERRLRAEKDKAKREDISNEMILLRRKYKDALIALKAKNPQLSNFVTVDPMTLKEVYEYLEPGVAFLEYMVTDKEVIAWILNKGSVKVKRTRIDRTRLAGMVKDFRQRIQSLAPVDKVTGDLYAILIKPLEEEIKGARLIGIAPHSILHYLSFAALRDEEGYFVEKHPVFYSPSASLLKFTMTGDARAIPKETKVLAIGNPDLKDLNYDLPLAEMEANAMRWDFPKVDILTREKAKESWVVKHIGEYDIIHIASHGEFDPINPLFSSLKLTRDLEQDGNLEANEIFGLNIKANLVTLSACQTGLGKITGGDELIGLNRAFFYAGTKSIVSSLWRVSDVSTSVLIKHFYRNYGTMSKAEALRKAQLQVKRYYPHPAYWAGFSLTGNYY